MHKFTAVQMAQIKQLVAAGKVNGNYSHIYKYIASVLPDSSEKRWFEGAEQANAGKGIFSEFIRSYSKKQMELRGATNYSDELMQDASNNVAKNAFADILGQNSKTKKIRDADADGNVLAPTITDIANADAIGVGDTLFKTIPNDSAIFDDQNAGWAGTPLFTGLGSDQTYRLFGASERGASFDKIDDLRNVLFARRAFYVALKSAVAAAASSSSLKDFQFFTDIGISLETARAMDLSNSLASNSLFATMFPATSPVRSLVLELSTISDANALDMVRRSVLGANFTPANEANFDQVALDFFRQLGDVKQLGLQKSPPASTLFSEAKTDFLSFMALHNLSLFKLTGAESQALVREKQPGLYEKWQADQALEGDDVRRSFTQQYLLDRLNALNMIQQTVSQNVMQSQFSEVSELPEGGRIYSKTSVAFPQSKVTIDLASNTSFIQNPLAISRPENTTTVIFGLETDNRQLSGRIGKDHIYAGSGNDWVYADQGGDYVEGNDGDDTINGGAGNDHLRGDSGLDSLNGELGNDTLQGGNGLDTLVGGEGRDKLDGDDGDDLLDGRDQNGQDGDELNGGVGFDTYYADQFDEISDKDGRGTVLMNGLKLGFARRYDGQTSYYDKDGNRFDLTGSTLTVNGNLTIKKFRMGDLGIYLDEVQRPIPSPGYDPRRNFNPLDPLAFDLNGDGKIATISSAQSTTYFDFNLDGIAEHSGWIGAGDGLLAIDTNKNGFVDNLSELFGNKKLDGYSDLKQRLDSNQDNVIDAADSDFAQLLMWQDANSDGISQAGELQTLTQLGIESINLRPTPTRIIDFDNIISATSDFVQHGQKKLSANLEFSVKFELTDSNPYRALDQEPQIANDIFGLPWLRGFGLVKDLHQAMDENPTLKQAAIDLASQSGSDILRNFEGFLSMWTGLAAAHEAKGVSRNYLTPEDKTWTMETLMGLSNGKPMIEALGFVRVADMDTTYLDSKYQPFLVNNALRFAMQARGTDWFEGAHYSLALNQFVVNDAALLQTTLQASLARITDSAESNFAAAMLAQFQQDACEIAPETLQTWLSTSPYADYFLRNPGVDKINLHTTSGTFTVPAAHQLTRGAMGDDIIFGQSGSDILLGGQGADILGGGAGDDIYLFERGDGVDLIEDGGGKDSVVFGRGIVADDIRITRDADHLYLSIKGSTDRIAIGHWSNDLPGTQIERLEFADGTVWDSAKITAMSLLATEESDLLIGSNGDDVMLGLQGNDSLLGEAGNDTINAGLGDDFVNAGRGDDVYQFALGDGQDTVLDSAGTDMIQFGEGIAPADLRVRRDLYNFYLNIKGSTEGFVVQSRIARGAPEIEQVRFADGTTWGSADLLAAALVPTAEHDYLVGGQGNDSLDGLAGNDSLDGAHGDDLLHGGSGDDFLEGLSGNDTLNGGSGNDTLKGGVGNDVYLYDSAGGQDVIQDAGLGNVIHLGTGYSKANLEIWRDRHNVYFGNYAAGDILKVQDGLHPWNKSIDSLRFADNTVWGETEFANAKFAGTSTSDLLEGNEKSNLVEGREGDDILYGNLGSDTLAGGSGNDLLDGGVDDDVYLLNSGDGQDTVMDSSGHDVIKLGAGFTPENVQIWRDRSNLTISALGSNESITLQGWFDVAGPRGDSVIFADNTVWDAERLATAPFNGTAEGDAIYATQNNEKLQGFAGDDYLYLDAGDDTVDGGSGNDTLDGGTGNDCYQFGAGYGKDSIIEAAGVDRVKLVGNIATSQIKLWRDSSHLYLGLYPADAEDHAASPADVLCMQGWFDAQANQVESLHFENGVVWGKEVLARATFLATPDADVFVGSESDDVLHGLGGHDNLSGNGGNDSLDGGTGNDALTGGEGDDSYLFDLGHGQDTIIDSGGVDVIQLGSRLNLGNVQIWRDAANLFVGVKGTEDVLMVEAWFQANASRVESIRFADNTVWNTAVLANAAFGGTAADDALTGNAAPNLLYGLAGNDVLVGMEGNDTLDGGLGNDSLDGGSGDDRYVFDIGYGQDVVLDAAGSDVIQLGESLHANNVRIWRDTSHLYLGVNGCEDVLTLQGWFDAVANRVESIRFADNTVWNTATLAAAPFAGSNADDTLNASNANDTLLGYGGNDSLSGNAGDDLLDGGTGNDFLDGGLGNDIYHYDLGGGLDSMTDAGGTDSIKVGAGLHPGNAMLWRDASNLYFGAPGTADILTMQAWFDASANRIESIKFANNTIWNTATLAAAPFGGTQGADYLYGSAASESFFGFAGNDVLLADAGNDKLDGGSGDDALYGADGNDSYVFGRGYGKDTISDSVGSDTVFFNADISAQDLLVTRDAAHLYLHLQHSQDKLIVQNFYADPLYKIEQFKFADSTLWGQTEINARMSQVSEGADFFWGLSSNELVDALAGDDQVFGNEGNDSLHGGNGDDTLDGGLGLDLMSGGLGQDVFIVDNVSDVVSEAAEQGVDTVQSHVTFALGEHLENLALQGSAAISGTGNAQDNQLSGNAADNSLLGAEGNDSLLGGGGNDTLDGGSGDDLMAGGVGNDLYLIDSALDTVNELADEGWDSVQASISFSLPGNVEDLSLTGGQAIAAYGNALNNNLLGNAAANLLVAGAGNDSLDGAGGADTLRGGLGDDRYWVDDSADSLYEELAEGVDTVSSSVSYTLPANLEHLLLSGVAANYAGGNALDNNLTGNAAANQLFGAAGNDVLDGKAGADTLLGGDGDDLFIVDNLADVVTEDVAQGYDTVQASVTFTLPENLENLSLTGGAAINATGNAAANVLVGNAAVNTLTAGAGNDTLDGGAGADKLLGGSGDDVYIRDNSADVITENANEGVDMVKTALTYTLLANLENLQLTGNAVINGTGNELNNLIIGNQANNVLDGLLGADTMSGGLGNDTYTVDNLADVLIENFNEGLDTVKVGFSYTLGANLENLQLTGSAAINATGNAANNALTGNTAANVLDGDAGVDTMAGGAGNDIYIVDNSADVVSEAANAGTDLVKASVSFTLASNVENLSLTGTAAVNAIGNASQNVLLGNSAANTLNGNAGADSMSGGAGDDVYVVDNIADLLSEFADEGQDLVNASVSYSLAEQIENLTLTGSTAINGTGNRLNNVLYGNTAANTLFGDAGNDVLDGKAGADTLQGGLGDDRYFLDNLADQVTELASEGLDQVYSSVNHTLTANVEALMLSGTAAINGVGNALDNLLQGNSGINTLDGAAGNDILQAAAGNDSLSDLLGNNLLDGGAGNDVLSAGAGNDFLIGGLGNDTIHTGSGADVIAFNRGDGADVVMASAEKDNTLSLGNGIKYADLLFQKSANDLILVSGASDKITFKDWYANPANHSVANLQVVLEGSVDYDAASASVIRNQKIAQFDFDGLVAAFDSARSATPTITSWQLSTSLLNFHLASSDSAALGADLAYQQARTGNLSQISLLPSQAILASGQFGTVAQNVQAVSALQDSSPRLL